MNIQIYIYIHEKEQNRLDPFFARASGRMFPKARDIEKIKPANLW